MAPSARPKTRTWANWLGCSTAWIASNSSATAAMRKKPKSPTLMPSRPNQALLSLAAPATNAPASSVASFRLRGGGRRGLLPKVYLLKVSCLALGEVELRLPDKAVLACRLAADASGRCGVGDCVDRVDGHDLEAVVAVRVEVVGADHADEAFGLGHLGPDLVTCWRAAVGVVDRAADGCHQRVGGVVRLHGVSAEVVWTREGLAERVDRGLCARDLGGVGARRGGVDVELVARRLVDTVGGLDTVTAHVRDVPADLLHLRPRDADVLVVGAADVNAGRARGLELEQDGAPVARLLLLVAAARHGAAVRLELRGESVGDADAEHRAVVQHADVVDVEGLVGVGRHRGTLVVVSGDDAEVVVRVTCSQVLRVVAARRQVLGQAGVGVRRADHREVLRGRDWNLGLGYRRVVRPDHAQELAVAQHALDVLDPGVCRIRGLPAVVEALVGDGVSVDSACAVLLVDGELDAVGGRLAADRTNGKVRPDLDRAFRPPAAAAAAAGERDERCHDEDSESPSSNHMVPPCVYGRREEVPLGECLPSFAALFPT